MRGVGGGLWGQFPLGTALSHSLEARLRTPAVRGSQSASYLVRIPGSGFRVPGSGFQVPGFGFRVLGSGFRVPDFGFRVLGIGYRISGFGFRVPGSEFQVPGFGFRERGLAWTAESLAQLYDSPEMRLCQRTCVQSITECSPSVKSSCMRVSDCQDVWGFLKNESSSVNLVFRILLSMNLESVHYRGFQS